MSDLDKINSIFNAKIDSVKSKEELQSLKTEFFGKNGQITQQFKNHHIFKTVLQLVEQLLVL